MVSAVTHQANTIISVLICAVLVQRKNYYNKLMSTVTYISLSIGLPKRIYTRQNRDGDRPLLGRGLALRLLHNQDNMDSYQSQQSRV